MLAAFSLSACTASTSHPSKLSGSVQSPSLAPVTASSSPAVEAASTSTPILVVPAESTKASNAGTPTSPPNSSPTAVPSGALSSQDIEAGVRATAQEFYDDFNTALETGEVAAINALTAPSCGCRSLVKTISQTYANHERFVDASFTVRSIDVVSFVGAGATAEVHYSLSAGRVLNAAGVQVDTAKPFPNGHSVLFVLKVGDHWVVEQNTLLTQVAS